MYNFIFLITYFLIYVKIKQNISKISKVAAEASKNKVETMQKAFGSTKNIIIDNLYEHFFEYFLTQSFV